MRARQALVSAILLTFVAFAAQADDKPAIVKNKEFSLDDKKKEVDAAVAVEALNGKPVTLEVAEVEVPPGEQEIEVHCTSRLFVGMGTVDFGKSVRMAYKFEPGKVYRLGARVDPRGDCVPTLDPAQ